MDGQDSVKNVENHKQKQKSKGTSVDSRKDQTGGIRKLNKSKNGYMNDIIKGLFQED